MITKSSQYYFESHCLGHIIFSVSMGMIVVLIALGRPIGALYVFIAYILSFTFSIILTALINTKKEPYDPPNSIEFPAGGLGIRARMIDLSLLSGKEIALIRTVEGTRMIVFGKKNMIRIPNNTARIIAHTHHNEQVRFSSADINTLLVREQRSSIVIS